MLPTHCIMSVLLITSSLFFIMCNHKPLALTWIPNLNIIDFLLITKFSNDQQFFFYFINLYNSNITKTKVIKYLIVIKTSTLFTFFLHSDPSPIFNEYHYFSSYPLLSSQTPNIIFFTKRGISTQVFLGWTNALNNLCLVLHKKGIIFTLFSSRKLPLFH